MSISLQAAGVIRAGGQRTLSGVDLEIAPGEAVAVIGPSGAGKTTLLRLCGAALTPGEGRLAVLGADPWALPPRALRSLRARIGSIHQAPPLPPRQRVITAVLAGRLGQWSLPRALRSLLLPADIAGAEAVLDRLDLADKLFERCDRLSGGQLQRVGIARVLYQQPQLILADEPVSALDPALAHSTMTHLIGEARARGATLLASLHAVDLALKLFPRIIGLRAGSVVFDLPATAVSPAMLAALYAGAAADPETAAIPGLPQANTPVPLAACC